MYVLYGMQVHLWWVQMTMTSKDIFSSDQLGIQWISLQKQWVIFLSLNCFYAGFLVSLWKANSGPKSNNYRSLLWVHLKHWLACDDFASPKTGKIMLGPLFQIRRHLDSCRRTEAGYPFGHMMLSKLMWAWVRLSWRVFCNPEAMWADDSYIDTLSNVLRDPRSSSVSS